MQSEPKKRGRKKQTADSRKWWKIPRGYERRQGEYPEHPNVGMFILPDIKMAIFNLSASPDTNIVKLVFK